MKLTRAALAAALLSGCGSAPRPLPGPVGVTAERYLSAWQRGDWNTVYRLEGRFAGSAPVLHAALTDSLAFYTVNEIRYSDSAAACAVTLQWQIAGMPVVETGQLFLERRGTIWRITAFRAY